jgi:FAD synthase
MNVGQRPTFADGTGDTVEVHVMHDFKRQFYGEELRVVRTHATHLQQRASRGHAAEVQRSRSRGWFLALYNL